MPGFDRTGPMGAGSMTGGGRGLCGAARFSRPPAPGGCRMGGGRGFGRGMGRGRGFGRGFALQGSGFSRHAEPTKELEMLKNEAEFLTKELDTIGKRIVELEKAPSA